MINDTAEKCRGCTLKHLTTVLAWLDDTDHPPVLRGAYICGNLAHAANHFIHYDKMIASKIRMLRIEGVNNDLSLNLDTETFKKRVEDLIENVASYVEPVEPPVVVSIMARTGAKTSGGCGCRKH